MNLKYRMPLLIPGLRRPELIGFFPGAAPHGLFIRKSYPRRLSPVLLYYY
jgi:hypothetical protein